MIKDMFENEPEIRVSVSAGIILRYNEEKECDEVLIIERAEKDKYPFQHETPRGRCEKSDSSLISCLKREVKEETGLDIKPIKFIGKFEYSADNGKRISTQHNYLCKMIDPNQKVKLSFEHDSYMWVSSTGLVNIHCLPEIAEMINRVLNPKDTIYDPPKEPQKQIAEFLIRIQT